MQCKINKYVAITFFQYKRVFLSLEKNQVHVIETFFCFCGSTSYTRVKHSNHLAKGLIFTSAISNPRLRILELESGQDVPL